jgi:hypothetical protein
MKRKDFASNARSLSRSTFKTSLGRLTVLLILLGKTRFPHLPEAHGKLRIPRWKHRNNRELRRMIGTHLCCCTSNDCRSSLLPPSTFICRLHRNDKRHFDQRSDPPSTFPMSSCTNSPRKQTSLRNTGRYTERPAGRRTIICRQALSQLVRIGCNKPKQLPDMTRSSESPLFFHLEH